MSDISNEDLINRALNVLNPQTISDKCETGKQACALVTDKGNVYTGVSIKTPCGMGFCAEHNAIGNMITNGEYQITKLVTVNQDRTTISPCGRCREFIYQITNRNLKVKIIMPDGETKTLADLLPDPWR